MAINPRVSLSTEIRVMGIGVATMSLLVWAIGPRLIWGYVSGAKEVSTEEALTAFALIAGVGGAASQVFAGNRLAQIEADTIPLRWVFPAIVMSGVASAVAGLVLIPNSEDFWTRLFRTGNPTSTA